ncbi:hypothetical protein IMCC3317_12990 [Kordia antarctica]|uniref:Cupin type-2 domain-containing protein n=1 Tax=Kordia antarctica TaxID=1218801 RepID=A0A7L4ZHJ1_9FLAO|nr:cupin domain-containing protein [Kordia antarctica]QHI35951.1 hypothetical protein IMCC3317_12990 [Kordia antarctica]
MAKQLIPQLGFFPQFSGAEGSEVSEVNLKEKVKAPFKASRWSVSPGFSSPVDQHEVKECWFVASGKGVLTFKGDIKGDIQAGDVIHFDPMESHQVYNSGEELLTIFSIWWEEHEE